jgi:alginate O-acetyltransferase complex protein AlgI
MRFNSLIYLAFLFVVVLVLWALPTRARRGWLLFVSYAFYASWHWPFVFLLAGVATYTWAASKWIIKAEDRRRRGAIAIAVNLAVLGIFKYSDWAVINANGLAHALGAPGSLAPPHWLLPLGVSFYVFECVSYIVDLVRKREKVHSIFSFHLYLAFFPHLVAGPILRAKELLPQIEKARPFDRDRFFDGIRMIATGLCLKTLLADGITPDIDAAFARTPETLSSIDVAVMAMAFGMQIYFDFASYSRIAIGSAKLCGIELVENFNYPYSAHSPSEFWNRWHMSLSRWIRDYLFYPLTKGRTDLWDLCRAAVLSMALCGLWHGAGWTFVVWGLYHGVLIAGYHIVTFRSRAKPGAAPVAPRVARPYVRAAQVLLTFG